MPRQLAPIISERDPLLVFNTSALKVDSKVDLTKFQPAFLSSTKAASQQQQEANKPKSSIKSTTSNWEVTLERCIKSIVSIKACRVRGLDTEMPGAYTATGFVVDPEQGIILSNRHVVSVSPITAHAVLCNYEEIELKPIYRDPVHDFGFFKYDPTHVRFLDIPGIDLCPNGVKIGLDIRVVGNDAGEKLSILSGTLARLDREAPVYGTGEYNDFNTFYYQAASSTSSGSSGSPVLDIHGRAVALNAGGAESSSSSYYLPLDRAHRALELIQNDKPIPRGTIQTTFEYQSYDTLLQLGLGRHLEKRLRSQSSSNKGTNVINEGLLVVKSVLPDGPAYGHLEPGDILLSCNGQLLSYLFIDLEEQLDNAQAEDSKVHMVVSRAGEIKEFVLPVQDLFSITPYRYLEFGNGVLNDLSYQIARSYGLSLNSPGVYVGTAGFILGSAHALRRSVIVGINNEPVGSLDQFVNAVSAIEQGKRVPIHFYSLSRPMKIKVMIVHMDWRWHKFRMAIRNDKTGYWDYVPLKTPLEKNTPLKPITCDLDTKEEDKEADVIKELKKSVVSVDCHHPLVVDGLKTSYTYGAGVIVSLNPPLIICDRDTVPIGINVISLTFENSVTISADLLFLHPFYNFAVLKFDPIPVVKAGIKIKAAALDPTNFAIGDSVNYVGLSGRSETDIKKTTISSLAPVQTKEAFPPRWRTTNVEAFKVSDGTLASQGGLLADDAGRVRAIWMSFSTENAKHEQTSTLGGLSSSLIIPVIEKIKQNKAPIVRGLSAEFWTMQISNARLLGVTDAWISKLKQKAGENSRLSVLYVLSITDISSQSGQLLKPGDIVLAINNSVLTSISDLSNFSEKDELDMTLVRDGKEMAITVPTTKFDGKETSEVIGWQGMLIQDAYASAKEQVQRFVPEGVYVSCCLYGSPSQAILKPGTWITEIDKVPVKTLSDFLEATDPKNISKRHKERLNLLKSNNVQSNVQDQSNEAQSILALPSKREVEDIVALGDDSHIQVKYISANNVTQVRALKTDKHYWPTWHIEKKENSVNGWEMVFLS